jgi:hypothetical protein
MAKVESQPSYVITLSEEEFKSLSHLLMFNENRIKDTHRPLLSLHDQVKGASSENTVKLVSLTCGNGITRTTMDEW